MAISPAPTGAPTPVSEEFKAVRPCIKCGATERNKKGDCKPCTKVRDAAYRAANPEKVKTYFAAWYAENAELAKANMAAYRGANHGKLKAYNAAWRKANPGKAKAVNAAWRAANPEKDKAAKAAWHAANSEAARVYSQNRRARKRESGGKLSKGLVQKLFNLQRGMCPCCKQPLGENYHLDHKMPLALGGQHTDDNMQLLRQPCNNQKHAKHPVDFMQSRGFLL